MSFYPSKTNTTGKGNPLLRAVGALLALASMLGAALGMFFRPNVPSLIFAAVVALFGLRVFVLWLKAQSASHLPAAPAVLSRPVAVSTYPSVQPPLSTSLEQPPVVQTKPFSPHQPAFAASIANSEQQPPLSALQPAYSSPPSFTPFTPAVAYASNSMQPAYTPQTAYKQKQSQPASIYTNAQTKEASPASYVPIDEDAIFELDAPSADIQCFILAKEGEPLVECQDRYALHAGQRCYAVADGVAGSFVPGPWARIVTRNFVERAGKFASQDDFQSWLAACSQQWHTWVQQTWVPTMNALRQRNGDRPGDWSNDIRQGAQTTLIGCTLHADEQHNARTSVDIFAIGDSEFFLFSPQANGSWNMVEKFPYTDPNQFGFRPDTLVTVTRPDLLERAWMQHKTMHINVYPGDLIVLATDALAKWLLTQVQQRTDHWLPFLSGISPDDFEQRIRKELHQNRIEDDDVTMLIIPIH